MKLNLNLIRDALLDIEELHHYPDMLVISDEDDLIRCKNYDFDDVLYHLHLLHQGEYIDWHPRFGSNVFYKGTSEGLTLKGHEFLNAIRGSTVWKKTQTKLNKIGSFTLDIVKEVAIGVLSNTVKGQL